MNKDSLLTERRLYDKLYIACRAKRLAVAEMHLSAVNANFTEREAVVLH